MPEKFDEPLEPARSPLDPELARLANALAGLEPRTRGLDRDALMFRAGQASVKRTGWQWPLATILSSVLAVAFGAGLFLELLRAPTSAFYDHERASGFYHKPMPTDPPPVPDEPLYPSERPSPSPSPTYLLPREFQEPPSPPHVRMKEQILRWGLDGLPAPSPSPAQPKPESIDMLRRTF
jgi:hypothetical protein